MRLKTWLLTGTSIGLLALAPIAANAQDAELQTAYQAYLEAQASGDAAALETAQTSLTELCIVGGYTSLEECLAALEAAAAAPPAAEEPAAEEPAVAPDEAAPAEEPAPAIEEPAPAEEPAAEAPAAEEPAAEQPAAEEPVAEEPVAEEPAMEPEPAAEEMPAAEQPAAEQPVAEEPVAEEPVAEDPMAEEPAAQAEQPAEDAAQTDIEAQLAAEVDAYNAAVADLSAGDADAQARIDAALAEITAICGTLGYTDNQTCVADFGLTLSPLPEAAPTEEQPAVPAPGDEQPAPVEETTSDGQPAEMVEDLPEGVTEDQIAPVLDSAKDEEAAPSESAQPVEGEAAVEAEAEAAQADAEPATQAEEPAAPPPASDEEAQAEMIQTMAAEPMAAVTAEEGTAVTAEESTTVNQTIVNNYVTNITNNVTGDNNTVTTGVQQTPVTVVEAPVVESDPGEAFTQLILQVGTQLFVNSVGLDTDRFYNPQEDEIYYERLSNDRIREVITRPDGTQIITVRNRNGDILRRSRITPDGREYVLAYFDDRYYDELAEWRDPAADLPPLRLNIPVREYVLDASYADEQELEVFFSQPPVERVARLYSIDEVKRSARLRDSVRRLEVGNLTFDTGAATIGRDQVRALSGVANAMLALLERNPNETFLIEGHTDAVGSDISNLRLSDLRAATVARVLTDFYGVPPENLATQGYGERYLKIRTEAAERENRRVTIRRITPLITVTSR
ncbi:OmpA family protein [Devosia salina]|uniref:OmpA family protein n=1 Tax=Devosia salina TaxID=2860336 RepID=A0ABX8WC32_9HYPH|nr:OmpA family protein [Devosia salina]QYO75690.1 OmpA family protein [Devosia salina]